MPVPRSKSQEGENQSVKKMAYGGGPSPGSAVPISADETNISALSLLDRKRFVIKDMPDGSRTVSVKNAGNQTMAALRELRNNRNMCDVIFQVNGIEVLAHRCILMVNSNYFHSMFTDGFQETLTSVIPLPSNIVMPESAETLIDFMYTGSLNVTVATVQNLIMAADLWEMMEAKDVCVDFMEKQIDAQNCLGVLTFGEMYHCDKLMQWCMQVIKKKFVQVVQSIEFVHLSRQALENILDLPDLDLGNEKEDVVLKALFRWLDFCPESRAADLPSLLKKVHLSATSKRCREKVLGNSDIVHGSEELKQLVMDLLSEQREARSAQLSLYVIGGFMQSRTGPKCPRLKGVEHIDPLTNRWTPCADFPVLSSGSFAFSIYGHLFCAVLEPINTRHASVSMQTKVFEYNFIRDEWADAQSSFSPESMECIDNCLQAEGALTVCHKTNTIYTVSRDAVSRIFVNLIDDGVFCREVRLLPRPTFGELFSEQHRLHSALVMDGQLYVLGGDKHDAGTEPVPTARAIMFDPEALAWVALRDMTERRAKMAAVALNGQIYAIGGFNERRLASMERYNPATDTWEPLAAMKYFRSHHQALAMDNKIWVLGGKSYVLQQGGARTVINLCEIYNPQTDTWTEGPPMKYHRCGFAAVTV